MRKILTTSKNAGKRFSKEKLDRTLVWVKEDEDYPLGISYDMTTSDDHYRLVSLMAICKVRQQLKPFDQFKISFGSKNSSPIDYLQVISLSRVMLI